LLITLLIAPGKVLAIFSDSINIKEAESIILDSMSEYEDYLSKYVLEWAEINKLDIKAISEWLEEVQRDINKFELES